MTTERRFAARSATFEGPRETPAFPSKELVEKMRPIVDALPDDVLASEAVKVFALCKEVAPMPLSDRLRIAYRRALLAGYQLGQWKGPPDGS